MYGYNFNVGDRVIVICESDYSEVNGELVYAYGHTGTVVWVDDHKPRPYEVVLPNCPSGSIFGTWLFSGDQLRLLV